MATHDPFATRPVDVLQRIYNKINTASKGWMEFAGKCTTPFEMAYKSHERALQSVAAGYRAQQEAMSAVLNILLGGVVGAWVPRLLKPVTVSKLFDTDALTNAWVKDALTNTGGEVKKALEGTIMGGLQKAATYSTKDPYVPVIENTMLAINRLKTGIDGRAKLLLRAMDELIEKPGAWTVPAATALELGFKNACPFITDEPTVEAGFEQSFRRKAELAMWISWGLARDEAYWISKSPEGTAQQEMFPILEALFDLGVPWQTIGVSKRVSMHQGPVTVFDMLKFINWAKLEDFKSRIPVPAWFRLQRNPNACYGGEAMFH